MTPTSLFDCPLPAALPTIGNAGCQISSGNIVAIALQQRQSSPTFNTTSIKAQATWTPLLAASDATKIVIVPVNNFVTTPGEAITEGGNDGTTYRGRPKFKGMGFTTASGRVEGITPALALQITALTKYSAQAGQRSRLRAFLLTDQDNIEAGSDYNGIEIFNWMLMDVTKGGSFNATDDYNFQFMMDYSWSMTRVIEKASFDLTLLQNA